MKKNERCGKKIAEYTVSDRKESKKLAEEKTEENLWQTIVAFQEYPFKTMTGLPFYYKLKIGKNGEWNKELLIDRREKSKSLAWSSIVLAFEKKQEVYRNGEQTQGTWGHKRYFLYISDFMEIWINRSSGKGRGDNEEKKRRKRFLVEIYTG